MELPDPSTLGLVKYPDPRLKRSCQPVSTFGPELRRVTDSMLKIMRDNGGVGLAGPQVGWLARVFVCNHTGEPEDDRVVVNPRFAELSGAGVADEGCLSIPDVVVPIRRALKCTMKAQDVDGRDYEVTAEDLLARVWQHENDHLEGKLIIDYMDETSRLSNRRALKLLEEGSRSRK